MAKINLMAIEKLEVEFPNDDYSNEKIFYQKIINS